MRRAALAVAALAAIPPAAAQQTDRIVSGYGYSIDGDSLVIAGDRIRLAGIDAPELEQEGEDKIGRTYPAGRFARDMLAAIIADQSIGCRVLPQKDGEKDAQGRYVAICATSTVPDVGAQMIGRGWALVDRSGETAIYGNYVQAETEARKLGRGVWQGRMAEPWTYRAETGAVAKKEPQP